MNSKILLLAISLFCSLLVSAQTPAETLVLKYDDVKGFKTIEVSGMKMAFARPILKKYPIGPMADDVTKVYVLKIDKPSAQERKMFFDNLKSTLKKYRYYGKSATPGGYTDVYVHMSSPEVVDELVIFNPQKQVLNVLFGKFPVAELLKLEKNT